MSTRKYLVDVDYKEVELNVQQQKKKLEKSMKLLEKLEDPNVDEETLKLTLGLVVEDTVFVSGLPEYIPELELRKLFLEYGTIKSLRIPTDHATGKSKKICFITFKEEKEARNALSANNKKFLDKHKIMVKMAESRSADDLLMEKLEKLDKRDIRKNYDRFEKTARRDFDDRHHNQQRSEEKDDHKEKERKHKKEKSKERSPRKRKHRSRSRSHSKDEKKKNKKHSEKHSEKKNENIDKIDVKGTEAIDKKSLDQEKKKKKNKKSKKEKRSSSSSSSDKSSEPEKK